MTQCQPANSVCCVYIERCQQVAGLVRGLPGSPPLTHQPRQPTSKWLTRSGLCFIEYDGRGRSMLIYQLNDPPVPRRQFHQLHDLPAWLVPLTYQDIILDVKERFPYLQVSQSRSQLQHWPMFRLGQMICRQ